MAAIPHVCSYSKARLPVNRYVIARLFSRPNRMFGRIQTTPADWIASERPSGSSRTIGPYFRSNTCSSGSFITAAFSPRSSTTFAASFRPNPAYSSYSTTIAASFRLYPASPPSSMNGLTGGFAQKNLFSPILGVRFTNKRRRRPGDYTRCQKCNTRSRQRETQTDDSKSEAQPSPASTVMAWQLGASLVVGRNSAIKVELSAKFGLAQGLQEPLEWVWNNEHVRDERTRRHSWRYFALHNGQEMGQLGKRLGSVQRWVGQVMSLSTRPKNVQESDYQQQRN